MALTGRADGPPLGPPMGFVERLLALEDRLQAEFRRIGIPLELDALALLGERAALAGLRRQGDRSCGGASRLLRAADGWLALSLARPTDTELLAAWLGNAVTWTEDPWSSVAPAVAHLGIADLVAGGALLGLPVAALPAGDVENRFQPASPVDEPLRSRPTSGRHTRKRQEAGKEPTTETFFRSRPLPLTGATADLPGVATRFGDAGPTPTSDLLVVDLSSLWAGPLCAQLLGLAGARIVKVESTRRPDGARFGPPAFFDLLHAGHESVAVDFTTPEGRDDLRRLLEAADVVIEGSRPRALQQLGIDAEALLRNGHPRLWISITGYGRTGEAAQRVAFGDDGAVAGGLVVWDDDGPCFCADAIADPLTGLVAATAVLGSIATGGRWLLDVSLQAVAAYFAADAIASSGATVAASPGETVPTGTLSVAAEPDGTVPTRSGPVAVAPPRARRSDGGAAPLGAHTEAVLAELQRDRR